MANSMPTPATASPTDDSRKAAFPFLRLYYAVMVMLIVLSIVDISISSDNIYDGPWKVSTGISASNTTLWLLLIAWIPVILPWLEAQLPRIRSSVGWLRSQGIEEIAASIFSIKIASGKETVDTYESKVIGSVDRTIRSPTARDIGEDLSDSYKAAIASVSKSSALSSKDALL
jgi:hypothetical protein